MPDDDLIHRLSYLRPLVANWDGFHLSPHDLAAIAHPNHEVFLCRPCRTVTTAGYRPASPPKGERTTTCHGCGATLHPEQPRDG